ncbi:hypothetical protein FNW52_01460 [Flavobacterium sp. ZT3R18]|uniref:hypothetical protein n=1 Tax=Flavobacterium sp. ZT3R18 TaxID=2594429 RepID=UPI00117B3F32|nr:hypothetical protein [Flavobacterium sp. ZT3R18]TRX38741.1 hypothetical protein FNW52_01460 [Flavobacterium sp. ZT3R18]
MTTTTLQKKLIQKISETNNLSILKSIENLLKDDTTIVPVKLSKVQKKIIALSEIDIQNGDVVEHTVAMKQIASKYGW